MAWACVGVCLSWHHNDNLEKNRGDATGSLGMNAVGSREKGQGSSLKEPVWSRPDFKYMNNSEEEYRGPVILFWLGESIRTSGYFSGIWCRS